MNEVHKADKDMLLIKECGKYKLFFKTFWLATNRPIAFFNLFIFLIYISLTLITLKYSFISMLTIIFEQRTDILVLGLVIFVLGVIVNLGMYKYVSWFHERGLYIYVEYDNKHYGGTFIKSLISVI